MISAHNSCCNPGLAVWGGWPFEGGAPMNPCRARSTITHPLAPRAWILGISLAALLSIPTHFASAYTGPYHREHTPQDSWPDEHPGIAAPTGSHGVMPTSRRDGAVDADTTPQAAQDSVADTTTAVFERAMQIMLAMLHR